MEDKSLADNDLVVTILHEQNQYREEIRMFDGHFFRVMVTYVTGLVAAFGWFGTQLIERAGAKVESTIVDGKSTIDLGAASLEAISELAQGPMFFLFAAVPLITALMFLFVARDWASLHERFALLRPLSQLLSDRFEKEGYPGNALFRLDRGIHPPEAWQRSWIEKILVGTWFTIVILVSVTVLATIFKFRDTSLKSFWWFVGSGGLGASILGVGLVLIIYRKRSYQAALLEKDKANDNTIEQ